MSWAGDYALETTFDFKFSTRQFSDGAPVTFSSGAVEIYEDNGTTQITGAETLTIDFDSITGLHNLRIAATAANGFGSGQSYTAVASAGTVGGTSVVGEVICNFSIERGAALRPTVAGRTLDVSTTGEAGLDWANIGSPTTAQNLSGTNIDVDQVVASVSGAVGSVTGAVGSVTAGVTVTTNNDKTGYALSAAGVDAVWDETMTAHATADSAAVHLKDIVADTNELQTDDVPGLIAALNNVSTAEVNTQVDTALADFWTSPATLVDLVWDEVISTSAHNGAQSAGQRLRQIDQAFVVTEGTADAGGVNTIDLETGVASTTDDIYNGDRVIIIAGTGVGEHGLILDYDGVTNQRATMSQNWVVQPDATSEYILVPADADVESWQHNIVTASGSGLPDVNVNEVGDTSQTAGDLAALITTVDTVVDGIQTDLDNGTDGLGALKVLIDAVQTDLDNGTDGLGALKTLIDGLNDISVSDVLTTQMTEAYSADGVAPTLAQALFLIQQMLTDFAISGTTWTTRKLDGSTTAATFTLDDGTNPTSITRAT